MVKGVRRRAFPQVIVLMFGVSWVGLPHRRCWGRQHNWDTLDCMQTPRTGAKDVTLETAARGKGGGMWLTEERVLNVDMDASRAWMDVASEELEVVLCFS